MYLVDTNVISERRKGVRAHAGVRRFFTDIARQQHPVFLSVITVGELRRGINSIRNRGDVNQAVRLETWLARVRNEFADWILDVDAEIVEVWGVLCASHPENPLDKLIAATALAHDLVVVTRNERHFRELPGVQVLNPFVTEPG